MRQSDRKTGWTTIRTFLGAAAIVASCLAPPVAADARPLGVVELFTSQGCNSCPPADAALGSIIQQGDILALAYHVDYWDYLGWKDTLGSHVNTERQYAYAKAFGSAQVYTPQVVVNGRSDAKGASLGAVQALLGGFAHSGKGLTVDLSIHEKDDDYVVDVGAAPGERSEARVVFVSFTPKRDVVIKRGENSGRNITYWHAVTGIHVAAMWHGRSARYEVPKSAVSPGGGLAVLLQSDVKGAIGPIIGAASLAAGGS